MEFANSSLVQVTCCEQAFKQFIVLPKMNREHSHSKEFKVMRGEWPNYHIGIRIRQELNKLSRPEAQSTRNEIAAGTRHHVT